VDASYKIISPVGKGIRGNKKIKNVRSRAGFFAIVNWAAVQERKTRITLQLKQAMQSGLHGIDFINKEAVIIDEHHIKFEDTKIETNISF